MGGFGLKVKVPEKDKSICAERAFPPERLHWFFAAVSLVPCSLPLWPTLLRLCFVLHLSFHLSGHSPFSPLHAIPRALSSSPPLPAPPCSLLSWVIPPLLSLSSSPAPPTCPFASPPRRPLGSCPMPLTHPQLLIRNYCCRLPLARLSLKLDQRINSANSPFLLCECQNLGCTIALTRSPWKFRSNATDTTRKFVQ